MPPGTQAERLAPLRHAHRQVGRVEVPTAEGQETSPEFALVERVTPVVGHGAQCPRQARQCHTLAHLERSVGAELARAGQPVDEMAGQGQHHRRREALLSQLDRGGEHGRERQSPEALVQRQPAVDGAGHLRAADVVADRHRGEALVPQAGGVGP